MCVCVIKLLCHFLPDLAQILNKAMNSIGAASKPVPGADFIQLLILLRNYFYALLLERHMIDKCSCEATRFKLTANQIARKWLNRNEIQTEPIFLEFNFLSLIIIGLAKFVAFSDRWRSEASHSAQKASIL